MGLLLLQKLHLLNEANFRKHETFVKSAKPDNIIRLITLSMIPLPYLIIFKKLNRFITNRWRTTFTSTIRKNILEWSGMPSTPSPPSTSPSSGRMPNVVWREIFLRRSPRFTCRWQNRYNYWHIESQTDNTGEQTDWKTAIFEDRTA